MYTIDATTGAAAEVAGSPFRASTDPQTGYVAAESTGQYVYVLKASLNDVYPAISTVTFDTFQVDPVGVQLVAQSSQPISLAGTLVSVARYCGELESAPIELSRNGNGRDGQPGAKHRVDDHSDGDPSEQFQIAIFVRTVRAHLNGSLTRYLCS